MPDIIMGEYNSTAPTHTGGTHPLQIDASGNLKVSAAGSERRSDAFQATMTSADAQFPKQVKALTAAKSIYITDVVISNGATAMNIQLQDTDATVVMEQLYFAANSTFSKTFQTPLKLASAKGLDVVASTAGNLTVTVSGYIV